MQSYCQIFLVYAENGPSTKTIKPAKTEGMDELLLTVNLARIRTQIMLAEKSLAEGDNYMAFAHAYIPHSVIFPSIKDILRLYNQCGLENFMIL